MSRLRSHPAPLLSESRLTAHPPPPRQSLSSVQNWLHPSPRTRLPSSQTSLSSRTPFPQAFDSAHTGAAAIVLQVPLSH
ncbi:MAG: hypothetical protein WBN29_09830, partial [Polyangiales bacterium]